MNELLCHLIGDYWLQTDWMATKKLNSFAIAAIHAIVYTLPFLFITHSATTIAVICITHAIIDRYRLAKLIPIVVNQNPNGYDKDRPEYLTTWLFIIQDNTLHMLINHLALMKL